MPPLCVDAGVDSFKASPRQRWWNRKRWLWWWWRRSWWLWWFWWWWQWLWCMLHVSWITKVLRVFLSVKCTAVGLYVLQYCTKKVRMQRCCKTKMAMVVVDNSCTSGGLTAQVRRLGLKVNGRLCAVLQFIKWTEWTLAMACGHDDSTINVVLVLLLFLLLKDQECYLYGHDFLLFRIHHTIYLTLFLMFCSSSVQFSELFATFCDQHLHFGTWKSTIW